MACAIKVSTGDDAVVPGNMAMYSMNPVPTGYESRAVWFPTSDEHLVLDAMTGAGISSATYTAAALIVEILEPVGANFVAMDSDNPPVGGRYTYNHDGGTGWPAKKVRVERADPGGTTLTSGNSASYYLGLAGRGAALLKLKIHVEITGEVRVVHGFASSIWEVRGLATGGGIAGSVANTPC